VPGRAVKHPNKKLAGTPLIKQLQARFATNSHLSQQCIANNRKTITFTLLSLQQA